MAVFESNELSAREYVLLENERDENRLIREHAEGLKRLEIELQREKNQAEIELRKLEAKWASWLSLPKLVIKLPVYLLLGIGYIIQSIRNQNPTDNFWDFINK